MILQKSAGVPEFDQLFEDMRTYVSNLKTQRNSESHDVFSMLDELIPAYTSHHPEVEIPRELL